MSQAGVTFRDIAVNGLRYPAHNLSHMKNTIPKLICTLLVATPVAADQPELRYRSAGALELRVEQDMYPGGRSEPIADRRFEMTFEFGEGSSAGEWQERLLKSAQINDQLAFWTFTPFNLAKRSRALELVISQPRP